MSFFDQVLSQTVSTLATSSTAISADTKKQPSIFEVESLPLRSHHGEVAGKKGIFVNGNCINIVSNQYKIHQPKKVYDTFEGLAISHGLTIDKVLTNTKNGGLLLSAHYADLKFLGEQHKASLVFYTIHFGKNRTFLTLDFLRVACFNQIPALYQNKQRHIISEKHYQNSLDINSFEKVLESLPAQIQAYNEKAETLQQKSLSFDSFRDLYITHKKLDENQKQFDSKMAEFKGRYFRANGQNGLAESAYKAFQAITYENTHLGRNTAMQLENSFIKGGDDSLVWLDTLLAA